jgi:hypothetical protein
VGVEEKMNQNLKHSIMLPVHNDEERETPGHSFFS